LSEEQLTDQIEETEAPREYIWGLGRRKTAVARVRLRRGGGKIAVNGKDLEEYFTEDRDRQNVRAPFTVTKTLGMYDCAANVKGGGFTGRGSFDARPKDEGAQEVRSARRQARDPVLQALIDGRKRTMRFSFCDATRRAGRSCAFFSGAGVPVTVRVIHHARAARADSGC
jgi:hypothetical protein